jgi:hypothetical protein
MSGCTCSAWDYENYSPFCPVHSVLHYTVERPRWAEEDRKRERFKSRYGIDYVVARRDKTWEELVYLEDIYNGHYNHSSRYDNNSRDLFVDKHQDDVPEVQERYYVEYTDDVGFRRGYKITLMANEAEEYIKSSPKRTFVLLTRTSHTSHKVELLYENPNPPKEIDERKAFDTKCDFVVRMGGEVKYNAHTDEIEFIFPQHLSHLNHSWRSLQTKS